MDLSEIWALLFIYVFVCLFVGTYSTLKQNTDTIKIKKDGDLHSWIILQHFNLKKYHQSSIHLMKRTFEKSQIHCPTILLSLRKEVIPLCRFRWTSPEAQVHLNTMTRHQRSINVNTVFILRKKIHIHVFLSPLDLNMLNSCEDICSLPRQDIGTRHFLLIFTVLTYLKLQSQSKNLNGVYNNLVNPQIHLLPIWQYSTIENTKPRISITASPKASPITIIMFFSTRSFIEVRQVCELTEFP